MLSYNAQELSLQDSKITSNDGADKVLYYIL